jgi:hypothetical protein
VPRGSRAHLDSPAARRQHVAVSTERERRSTCSVPGCEPVASATAERSRRIIWVDRRAPWRAQGQAHARRACSLALAHTPCYLGGAPRPLVDCLQQLCHCSAICAAAADGEPTSGQPARTRRACSAQLVLRCVVHVGCALHALRHPRIRRVEWCAATRNHSRPAPTLLDRQTRRWTRGVIMSRRRMSAGGRGGAAAPLRAAPP